MLHSTRTHGRLSAATIIATMVLTTSFVIAESSTASARSADRETLTQAIDRAGLSRVAMSLAGPAASRTATVEDVTALEGPGASKDGTPKKKALVGSWLETVTFPPESGRPPLKSLVSFHDDGIMAYSDQGNVTTEPPTVFSSGNGVWTHLQQRTFAYTSLGLISDLSGNLVGYLKARGIYTVSQSGNEYNGTTDAEILDPNGTVLFSVTVTNAGQRIQLELP